MQHHIRVTAKVELEDTASVIKLLNGFEDLANQADFRLRDFGLDLPFLGIVFLLMPEGARSPIHKDGARKSVADPDFKGIILQRHVDYQQFLTSDEAGRLALLARALLEGVLELPKARGLKRFDARGLHEALRSFFVSKGVMELEENL